MFWIFKVTHMRKISGIITIALSVLTAILCIYLAYDARVHKNYDFSRLFGA